MTMLHRILIAPAFIAIIALIFGCARHQPYGDDIWLGVREVDRGRG